MAQAIWGGGEQNQPKRERLGVTPPGKKTVDWEISPKTHVEGGEMVQDADLIWFEEGLSVLN